MSDKTISIDNKMIEADGRFSRFELISWWDQTRLRSAKVLVIGAGALGNEIIKNCALVGMGNLLVADMDRIEHSNLSRSVLFRERHMGAFKADTACDSAREIYPEMNLQAFNGNIVHDLGLGVFFWADVIIGGLDNREARVCINSRALFANKPWIDGAIEVLNGVARVFFPDDGPCYECTMSDIDWKILEQRRSCALLTREEMETGRVPTTPTISSIISGVEVQEAIKILHGMDCLKGQGIVFSGTNCESYLVRYTRKSDCMAHITSPALEVIGKGVNDITVGELLAAVRKQLGPETVLELSRDVISALSCMSCGVSTPQFSPLGKVSEKDAVCPACGQTRAPELFSTIGYDATLDQKTFADIGVPAFDVITARGRDRSLALLFDGDAKKLLGNLEYSKWIEFLPKFKI